MHDMYVYVVCALHAQLKRIRRNKVKKFAFLFLEEFINS